MVLTPELSYGVIILAAGRSRRMGRCKMLLPWGSFTVLGWLIEQWEKLGVRQIVVVCSSDEHRIQEELDRLCFPEECRIFNPAPEKGMFSSIQCAVAWKGWREDITHWIISLGDQPQVHRATMQALLRFAEVSYDKICQPTRLGRRKHPVVIPKHIFCEMKRSTTTTLKHFLDQYPNDLSGFESGDVGLDLDMDTPDDYEKAIKGYFHSVS